MINIKDIYWLAGLLEGEGHFAFYDSPRIQLTMTDEDVVAKARIIIKTDNKISIYKPRQGQNKPSYKITISGITAISWMMTLYPLMGRRRKETIRNVIKEWKLTSNRSSDSDYCKNGHPLLIAGIDFDLMQDNWRKCKICASPEWAMISGLMKLGLSKEQAIKKLGFVK